MLVTVPTEIPEKWYYYDEVEFKYKLVKGAPPKIVKIFNEWQKELEEANKNFKQ